MVAELQFDEGTGAHCRVGIATGRVVIQSAGVIESFGETMNLAARLQTAAGPDEIMVDESTFHALENVFVTDPARQFDLKGFPRPISCRRVRAERRSLDRFEARGRDSVAFVGRTEEVNDLEGLWGSSVQGRGRVVVVTGEPGIGKSRLVREFLAAADVDDPAVIRLQCSPYRMTSVFHPISAAVQRFAGIDIEADSELARRSKLASAFGFDIDSTELPVIDELLANSRSGGI